jgi:hypothetical protein
MQCMTRNQGSNFASNITSFLSLPLWHQIPKKVTHHLPEEEEEALHDNKDMVYNPEEEINEGKH